MSGPSVLFNIDDIEQGAAWSMPVIYRVGTSISGWTGVMQIRHMPTKTVVATATVTVAADPSESFVASLTAAQTALIPIVTTGWLEYDLWLNPPSADPIKVIRGRVRGVTRAITSPT